MNSSDSSITLKRVRNPSRVRTTFEQAISRAVKDLPAMAATVLIIASSAVGGDQHTIIPPMLYANLGGAVLGGLMYSAIRENPSKKEKSFQWSFLNWFTTVGSGACVAPAVCVFTPVLGDHQTTEVWLAVGWISGLLARPLSEYLLKADMGQLIHRLFGSGPRK